MVQDTEIVCGAATYGAAVRFKPRVFFSVIWR